MSVVTCAEPLSDAGFANMFFLTVACLFICLTASFEDHTFSIVVKANLPGGSFMGCTLGPCIRNLCPTQSQKDFSPVFYSGSSVGLSFAFRSMICFELFFVYDVKHRFTVIFSAYR